MSKVKNKKEEYCSRSNLVSTKAVKPSGGEAKTSPRSVFSVDANGYFSWANNSPRKKDNHF